MQGWGKGSRVRGHGQSKMFQKQVGTVIFLSPLFSFIFFNRQLVAEVIQEKRNRDDKCTAFGTNGKNSLDVVGPQNSIFGIPQYSETWLRK